MNSTEDDIWTRKLSDKEDLMCKCYDKGFMIIRYILVLNSKEPLIKKDVETALGYLFRKVQTLRLIFNQKKGVELWFRKMTKEKLDFKVIDESDYAIEKKNILNYKFDLNDGPLWCVRVAISSQKCPMPEIKEEFPHQYNLLFGFHHSITDGISNIAICNLFLNLLNDIISHKDIDDQQEQLGYHASEDQWQNLKLKIEQDMTQDSARFAKAKDYYEQRNRASNALRALFPFTGEEKPTIKCIYFDFKSAETQKIIAMCRAHGITLNSFMSTIMTTSIIDIIKKETPEADILEEYTIPNRHLVSIRRYLKNVNKISLGCFAANFLLITKVHSDILKTFWEHAKRFDEDFKMRLNNFASFENEIYEKFTASEETIDPFQSDDPQDLRNVTFYTSNVGNLSKTFPGTGENVQVTFINRTTLVHKVYCTLDMHSFRGRLLFFALDYNPMYLTKEIAKYWADIIVGIINQKLNE